MSDFKPFERNHSHFYDETANEKVENVRCGAMMDYMQSLIEDIKCDVCWNRCKYYEGLDKCETDEEEKAYAEEYCNKCGIARL